MIIFYAASAVIGILMMIIYRGLNNKKIYLIFVSDLSKTNI